MATGHDTGRRGDRYALLIGSYLTSAVLTGQRARALALPLYLAAPGASRPTPGTCSTSAS